MKDIKIQTKNIIGFLNVLCEMDLLASKSITSSTPGIQSKNGAQLVGEITFTSCPKPFKK
jgi:hypothetical protein